MGVDKSNERVRAMFGEIAPRYDLLNHLLSLQIDRYWRWRTVRLAPPVGDAPILDLCTGTGDLALAYARAAARAAGGSSPGEHSAAGDAAAPVVAADFCHPMLVRGDAKRRRAGLNGQVTFVEADTQRLPFPDDYFQLVSVAFGLRNVSDTDRGLAEMARVCRPGGRVVVLEFSQPRWQPLGGLYRLYFQHVLPRIGQWLARNRHDAYSYLPESVNEFPSGEALLERMRAAGLASTRHVPLTLGVASIYVGTKA